MTAGKDSLALLKASPMQVAGLRLGYSAVWRLVMAGFAGGVLITCAYVELFSPALEIIPGTLGRPDIIRVAPGIPLDVIALASLIVALGIVSVLVRPFFLLGVAGLYAEHVDVKAEIEGDIPDRKEQAPQWQPLWLLLAAIAVVVLFADDLGRSAARDLFAYAHHLR
jgi:hypothetical protein